MPKELTPTFTVISKACDGDETAISKILEFYDPYINQCCMRPFYDDNNNLRDQEESDGSGLEVRHQRTYQVHSFDMEQNTEAENPV